MRSRSCPSDPQERVWGSGQRWGIPLSQTQEPEGESGSSQRGNTGGRWTQVTQLSSEEGVFLLFEDP